MQPEHLSLYSLIVEENTPLHHWVEIWTSCLRRTMTKRLTTTRSAMECLDAAGYQQYEVSNWART